jgi:hypothetical protein
MYVIVVRTGFCNYYVQLLRSESEHVRHHCLLSLAVRFRTSDEARKHVRSGEELEWLQDG